MRKRTKQRQATGPNRVLSNLASLNDRPGITVFICLLLVTTVWIVFGQTLGHGFVDYDDNLYVYDNPKITAGLTLSSIGWAFTHVHADNWHPLTTISHMLDVQIYGLNPLGHHLTNVLLHSIAVVLLFLAFRKLTLSIWPSAFVAALFAIHPLRVESVAWISERKDVLSGIFFALTLWAYAGYVRDERRRRLKYFLVIACFALGLLSKPTLVTLPFVLLLLDYWPLQRIQRGKNEERKSAFQHFSVSVFLRLVVEKVPLFLLSAAACVVTIVAQKEALETTVRLSFHERFANAAISYAIYLGQLVYPVHLTPLNAYSQVGPGTGAVIVCLLLLWAITIAFVWWRKRFPFLVIGWLWYLGMLVPMSGIVQVGRQTHADRYTYLSQIGLYLIGTWSVIHLVKRYRWSRQGLAITAVSIVVILAAASYLQAAYWKDSETLWKRALEVDANNYVAHNNLGNSIMTNGHIDEAIRHFKMAAEMDPTYAEAHYNLGNALAAQDRYSEAISAFQKAITARPKFYQAHNNLGCMLINIGKTDQAIGEFNEALRIHADYQEAHLNLGQLLTRLGRSDEANAHLAEAAKLKAIQGEKKSVSNMAPGPGQ